MPNIRRSLLLFGCFLFFNAIEMAGQLQIPNAGFEAWEIRDGIEEPVGWSTTNYINTLDGTQMISVTKDSVAAYKGKYAIKITNSPFVIPPIEGGNCPGFIGITIDVQKFEYLKSLKVWLKFLKPVPTGQCEVGINNITNGVWEEGTIWTEINEIPNYTFFEIPIDKHNVDTVGISFSAGAQFSQNGCVGDGILWVDDLELVGDISSSYFLPEGDNIFHISPNPTFDFIKITIPKDIEIKEIMVYSTFGQCVLVFQGNENYLDISSLNEGIYLVNIIDVTGRYFISKFLKSSLE